MYCIVFSISKAFFDLLYCTVLYCTGTMEHSGKHRATNKATKEEMPYNDEWIACELEVGHRGDIHRWSGTSTAIFINFTLSTGGSRWNLRLFDSKIHLPNPPPRKKQTSNQTLNKMVVEVWNEFKKSETTLKKSWNKLNELFQNTLKYAPFYTEVAKFP